jgi:hypothetical protein
MSTGSCTKPRIAQASNLGGGRTGAMLRSDLAVWQVLGEVLLLMTLFKTFRGGQAGNNKPFCRVLRVINAMDKMPHAPETTD